MSAVRVSMLFLAAAWLTMPTDARAQNRGAAPPPPAGRGAAQVVPGAGRGARAQAGVDLTGYWVAIVNEDWRYRMVTPPKADYCGVPMTKEATQIANTWNPAADEAAGNQCKSYGAAAIMRVPGRIHVTWEDDNTLRLDTDAGTQTRLFRFAPAAAPSGAPTWQGTSIARWERQGRGGGGPSGSLTVVTTNLKAGYLRKNGVPYSENATVTEYFDVAPYPDGLVLVVTTVVDDPRYLTQPFIVSSHFKREPDASKWDPTPCSATW